jgi:hypothetical protein
MKVAGLLVAVPGTQIADRGSRIAGDSMRAPRMLDFPAICDLRSAI